MSTIAPIGRNEVRITNVWTVEAANEFSTGHDDTPNVREGAAPTPGVGAFHLRIHAEVGETLGTSGFGYTLYVQPVCLTLPFAGGMPNMNPFGFGGIAETFAVWEHRTEQERWTRDWTIPLPLAPGVIPFIEAGQIWQYIVTLVDTTGPGGIMRFEDTFVSEPFRLSLVGNF